MWIFYYQLALEIKINKYKYKLPNNLLFCEVDIDLSGAPQIMNKKIKTTEKKEIFKGLEF